MVAPRGVTSRGVRPPLAPAPTRHSKKTPAPATVTKTPARGGIRSSPRHTQSTNAAASALTNLAEQARNNSATPVVPAAGDPVSTTLFHPTSYAAAAATTGYDDNNDTQYDESQALLSPEAPFAEVVNTGRGIVQSQLTASTGLGDDFLSSSGEEEEEKAGEHEDGDFTNPFENNYDDIDDDGIDANVNDYAADKYDFHERMHHYMGFLAISSRNVRAVEYCCMTQANTIVYNNQTKGRAKLDEEHLREYLKLVKDIPDAYFVNHTVKATMLEGYVGMRGKTVAGSTGKKKAIAAGPFARREATGNGSCKSSFLCI